jgi:hypothetical protein
VLGKDSRPKIISIAGKVADDNADCLALVERRLSPEINRPEKKK